MELKKDETPKKEISEFSERPSVNDALFGNTNMDTPYQIQSGSYSSSSSSSKKSEGSNIVKIAIIALIAVFVIGGVLSHHKKVKARNGNYVLVEASNYGLTYSVEELEKISGMNIFASLTIDGSECRVIIDYTYIKTEGVGKIKFKGNELTITDCSEELSGIYNPDNQTIVLDANGVEMTFEKID